MVKSIFTLPKNCRFLSRTENGVLRMRHSQKSTGPVPYPTVPQIFRYAIFQLFVWLNFFGSQSQC